MRLPARRPPVRPSAEGAEPMDCWQHPCCHVVKCACCEMSMSSRTDVVKCPCCNTLCCQEAGEAGDVGVPGVLLPCGDSRAAPRNGADAAAPVKPGGDCRPTPSLGRPSRRHAATIGDGPGQVLEVPIAVLHGVQVASQSAVGGAQMEHWLACLVSHRHQATIVLQRR